MGEIAYDSKDLHPSIFDQRIHLPKLILLKFVSNSMEDGRFIIRVRSSEVAVYMTKDV
jgi:hypothetical protein